MLILDSSMGRCSSGNAVLGVNGGFFGPDGATMGVGEDPASDPLAVPAWTM